MKLVGNCGTVIIRQDLGSTGGDVPLPLAVLYRFAELGAARQGQGRYRTTGLSPTHTHSAFPLTTNLFRPPIKKHRLIRQQVDHKI